MTGLVPVLPINVKMPTIVGILMFMSKKIAFSAYLSMKTAKFLDTCIFSSPEHEVLMVSYCDQSMSVVRRASCVVRRQQFVLKANSS